MDIRRTTTRECDLMFMRFVLTSGFRTTSSILQRGCISASGVGSGFFAARASRVGFAERLFYCA